MGQNSLNMSRKNNNFNPITMTIQSLNSNSILFPDFDNSLNNTTMKQGDFIDPKLIAANRKYKALNMLQQ